MMKYELKQLAYLGDALWELIIRKIVIEKTAVQKKMHNLTTSFVNASFQAELLNSMMPLFSEEEKELIKKARNIKLNINKKCNPLLHTQATAFEAILGYFYIEDTRKFEVITKIVSEIIKQEI